MGKTGLAVRDARLVAEKLGIENERGQTMLRNLAIVVMACVVFAGASGCGGSDGKITVSPESAEVTVGGGPVTFTATLTDFPEEREGMVSWTLDGPGSTTPPVIKVITYTPPTTGGAATATLTAHADGRSATATITIRAAP